MGGNGLVRPRPRYPWGAPRCPCASPSLAQTEAGCRRAVFRWVGAGLFSGFWLSTAQPDRPVLLLGPGAAGTGTRRDAHIRPPAARQTWAKPRVTLSHACQCLDIPEPPPGTPWAGPRSAAAAFRKGQSVPPSSRSVPPVSARRSIGHDEAAALARALPPGGPSASPSLSTRSAPLLHTGGLCMP